jgi:glutamine synthetase
VDGSANPYLACAVVLAAGLDGIKRQLEPGRRNDDNLYDVPEAELRHRAIGFLPTTLSEALDHLERDQVIIETLGADYAAYYLQVKREEWHRYNQSVSRWETDNYLGVY